MGGLVLGDIILDARRVVYVRSLRAVVCADLHGALTVGIAGGLRGVLERVDAVLAEYHPENLIIIGPFDEKTPLAGIARRWGRKAKIQLVAAKPDADARAIAEALDCEVHNELLWGRYRFVETVDESALELQAQTIAGGPHYSIRVGNRPFGGMKLVVFVKGLGKLILPSMSPEAPAASVFCPELERYDIFAAGYQRVLPMGKVADLKAQRGFVGTLPLDRSVLRKNREPDNTAS